jgi:hypothetical protein
MSPQTGVSGDGGTRGTAPARERPQTLDVIATDGPGMIAAIKGPCPDCGGRFELVAPSSEDRLL